MLHADGKQDDTLQLQAMLDAGGVVTIDRPGEYLVSKTLIIHSNTRLILCPGVKLLAAPMSKCALIENEHFAGGGTDENIEIVGGIWDGNCDEMGLDGEYEAKHRLDHPFDPKLFKGKLIRFCNIERLTLMRMTVRNPVSYGIQIGAVRGFVVRDIFFDYNWHFGTADGVHINGPACDGVIENLCGTTNDDLVSLTTYDEPHAEISIGHIENIVMRNLSAKNGYSAVRLLSGEDCYLRNVHIEGIYGTYRHHAVVISNHNLRPGKVWFDGLTIERIHAQKSNTPLGEGCFRLWEDGADKDAFIAFQKGARCGSVVLRDIYRNQEHSTQSPLLQITADCEIDRLVVDNFSQVTPKGVSAPVWEVEGTIHQLIERNVEK